jgi:hypothetical protein
VEIGRKTKDFATTKKKNAFSLGNTFWLLKAKDGFFFGNLGFCGAALLVNSPAGRKLSLLRGICSVGGHRETIAKQL